MIGQIAIPIALIEFNNLGRSVTPTFLFRNRFYLQLSSLCQKTNKKINIKGSLVPRVFSLHGNEVLRKVKKSFLSTGHGILPPCGCKARETMVAKCELVL